MATCPHCLGPLTDAHRCPRKRQKRNLRQAGAAGAGAAAGFVAMALLDPNQRATHLDVWVIGGSALLFALAWRALSRGRD